MDIFQQKWLFSVIYFKFVENKGKIKKEEYANSALYILTLYIL
jgi:hypothetical protein